MNFQRERRFGEDIVGEICNVPLLGMEDLRLLHKDLELYKDRENAIIKSYDPNQARRRGHEQWKTQN